VHRAGPDAPPFLVVHGSADTIAGVAQSRRLVRRLREVGAPVCYAELPRAQHGFDSVRTARTRHTVRAVHRFLSAVHERYRSAGDPGVRPATAPAAGAQAASGASSIASATSS
jgi:hypothetical protein